MSFQEKLDWLKANNLDIKFSGLDVRVCRVNTKCDDCKKKIKRGSVYLRRSFGRAWTWKACSEPCAESLVKQSVMWTR